MVGGGFPEELNAVLAAGVSAVMVPVMRLPPGPVAVAGESALAVGNPAGRVAVNGGEMDLFEHEALDWYQERNVVMELTTGTQRS